MASLSNNPFYGSSSSQGTVTPASGSTQRLALDNLIRRELKVGDPNDPAQIAQALLNRYKESPRAIAIKQEARGLPFLLSESAPSTVPQAATSSDAELQQAKNDVERDLQELLTNSLLKDVTPEIQGWAQAVRSAIAEGATAARFGLDPRQRDKAFAIRRQLGDYARLARLVGALTPSMNMTYRKFAQSLDEVAAVLLVLLGEALSSVGFGGRFLLQAPFSELQARRDAVIYALRNLVGATQQAYGPNDWPRGLDAYRNLFRVLEDQGQGDLRSLLLETELARSMDELIQRAAHGTADGLRALGSTAQLDLERFHRMVFVGQNVVSPESPPLAAFLEALKLFADTFDTSGGFRLVRVSRPPILFYGLYGNTVMDDADQRLLNLIIRRGLLADQLDCFMQCGCSSDAVKCQIVLDKILYDVDRAIDLYAIGKEDFGQPERRAAAYGFVIESFEKAHTAQNGNQPSLLRCEIYPKNEKDSTHTNKNIKIYLDDIKSYLHPDLNDPDIDRIVDDLKSWAEYIKEQLSVVRKDGTTLCEKPPMIPTYSSAGSMESKGLCKEIEDAISDLQRKTDLSNILKLYTLTQKGQVRLEQYDLGVVIQDSVVKFLGILQQELCIQKDMEKRWENLVKTMAPNCVGFENVFNTIGDIIQDAIERVSSVECAAFRPSIPPHFETSLDSIVDDVDRMGRGRPTN